MILQQQDNSVETLCKDCVFAIYEGEQQTGCHAGRLSSYKEESIKEATDGDKEFYVIKGICPSYRPPKWGEADLGKMRDELKLSFSLILDVQDYKREELQELEYCLTRAFYYEDVDVVVAHKPSYPHKDLVIQMIHQWLGKKKFQVVQYHEDLEKPEVDAELLTKVRGRFFCMSRLSHDIEDFLRSVNHSFNTNNEMFIAAEQSEMVAIMSSALRFYRMSDNKTYEDFKAELLQGAEKAKLYKKY